MGLKEDCIKSIPDNILDGCIIQDAKLSIDRYDGCTGQLYLKLDVSVIRPATEIIIEGIIS